jgi:hypothetical protein
VTVQRVDLDLVEELDPGHRQAVQQHCRRTPHGIGHRGERAARGADALGCRVQSQRRLGHDPQQSFRADEQPREVQAGGLARPRRRADHRAARRHHHQGQHVLAHPAVADRRGPRGARGDHPPDRRVRTRVDREEDALVAQAPLELEPGHAGLDVDVHVLDRQAQDLVHLRQIDADAAADRHRLPLQ